MSRSVCGAIAIVLLLGLSGSAPAQEVPAAEQYHLRVEYLRWSPSLGAKFQKGAEGRAGTLIDAVDDLGVGDRRTYGVRATLRIKGRSKLRGSYTPLDYDGAQPAPRTFRFHDTTYSRFVHVVTSLKGGYYTGEYELDFVKGPHGFLGGFVGAKIFDVDVVILGRDTGQRELDTLRAPIPVVGLSGRIYSARFSLAGEVAGLTLGKRGNLIETDVTARVHLSDRLAVQGGHRYLSLRAEDAPDLIKFHLGGWTYGLELSL